MYFIGRGMGLIADMGAFAFSTAVEKTVQEYQGQPGIRPGDKKFESLVASLQDAM
jgi:hypothetical protein